MTFSEHWAVRRVVAAEKLEGWHPNADDYAILMAELNEENPLPALLTAWTAEKNAVRRRYTSRRSPQYLYPSSSTLCNKLGISDYDELQRVEFVATAVRLLQFHLGRAVLPPSSGVRRLLRLHEFVFQDMYDWAGCVRTVNLSKNGTPFAPVPHIWTALASVDDIITNTRWATLDSGDASYVLSRVYTELNHAHPFREGNGRAATTLLHDLMSQTTMYLDLGTVSRAEWIEASRDSAPFRSNGVASPRPFVPIFRRALQPRVG